MKKSKDPIPEKVADLIGQTVQVGDWAVTRHSYGIKICEVTRLTAKMVGLSDGRLIYSTELVKLTPEQVTWYLLQKGINQ